MNRRSAKKTDAREPIAQKKRDADFSGTTEEEEDTTKRPRVESNITTSTPEKLQPEATEPRPEQSPISVSDDSGSSGQAQYGGSWDEREERMDFESLKLDVKNPNEQSNDEEEEEEEESFSTQQLIPPGQKRYTCINTSLEASSRSINIPEGTPFGLQNYQFLQYLV